MAVLMILLGLLAGQAPAAAPPDLSGNWVFDQAKTMQPGPDGRVVLAAMLGDEVTILQRPGSLTLRIIFNGELVVAVYDLTGKPTVNVSPGDIEVTSRVQLLGGKLAIDSASAGEENGKPVTIRTRRLIWIDEAGDLIVERSGTPASMVTPSRSVYRRGSRPLIAYPS